MISDGWLRQLLLLALVLLPISPVLAGDSLSLGEAQKAIFPTATAFDPVPPDVVARWQAKAADDPDISFLGAHIAVARALRDGTLLGWIVTDNVVGKFEKVDYAAGFDLDGKVIRVEILKYREKHGFEVQRRNWLAQFEGRDAASGYQVEKDIDGISGATLSCTHVSAGVQRLANVMAEARKTGAR